MSALPHVLDCRPFSRAIALFALAALAAVEATAPAAAPPRRPPGARASSRPRPRSRRSARARAPARTRRPAAPTATPRARPSRRTTSCARGRTSCTSGIARCRTSTRPRARRPSTFGLLKTAATTPSGNPKDQFHFTYPTTEWVALSQSGVTAGYGARVGDPQVEHRRGRSASPTPSRTARRPTAPANLARGAQVLAVDGVDMVNANDSAERRQAQRRPVPGGDRREPRLLDSRSRGQVAPQRDARLRQRHVDARAEREDDPDGRRSGRLHALQRPHRDRRAAAGQRLREARRGARRRVSCSTSATTAAAISPSRARWRT